MKLQVTEMFITLTAIKIVFFIAIAHVLSLLWQLKVSIGLKFGKVKVGLIEAILTSVLQKCSLSIYEFYPKR